MDLDTPNKASDGQQGILESCSNRETMHAYHPSSSGSLEDRLYEDAPSETIELHVTRVHDSSGKGEEEGESENLLNETKLHKAADRDCFQGKSCFNSQSDAISLRNVRGDGEIDSNREESGEKDFDVIGFSRKQPDTREMGHEKKGCIESNAYSLSSPQHRRQSGTAEAQEALNFDASNLDLPRIKTRSWSLSEDGFKQKVRRNVSNSTHFDSAKATVNANSGVPSKCIMNEEALAKPGKGRFPTGRTINERSEKNLPMSTVGSFRQSPQKGPISQGFCKGFLSKGTEQTGSEFWTGRFDGHISNAYSDISEVVDVTPRSSNEKKGYYKTEHVMENEDPSHLASYFKSDCNRTSDDEGPLDVVKENKSRLHSLTHIPWNKVWPKDIKSFSHELGPTAGHRQNLPRSRSDNDLEELLEALQERFNIAKEEVDIELSAFAVDLVETLDKSNNLSPSWQEKVEDLLVLARRCTIMSACDFQLECESIVQELDDKRQELPTGFLKQLHIRMLFILTRCTRLSQFQKATNAQEKGPFCKIQQCLRGVPSFERTWAWTDTKKVSSMKDVSSDLLEPPDGYEPPFSVSNSIKVTRMHKVYSERGQNLAFDVRKHNLFEEFDSVKDNFVSFTKSVDMVPPTKKSLSHDLNEGFQYDDTTGRLATWDVPAKAKKLNDDEIQEAASITVTPTRALRRSWGYWWSDVESLEEPDQFICRICEVEIPTSHLEEHSVLCAIADTCDRQGSSLNERLRSLADFLERLSEISIQNSSHPIAGNNADFLKVLRLNLHESTDSSSPSISDLHGKGAELRFDDFNALDPSISEESKWFNSLSFRPHLGPQSDQGVGSSSAGSLTPRSTLTTPRTSQFDLPWAERVHFIESDDLKQIYDLIDIARCVANKTSADEEALEFLAACMHDLQNILAHTKNYSLSVGTFGSRIKNLLREKCMFVYEAVDHQKLHIAEDDGAATDERFDNLNRTPVHPSHKDRTTIEDFEILKPISRGAFGRVFLARKRTTGDLFAIKVLRKIDMIRKNAVENILAERDILITVCNPFVVRFFYSFTCRENLYLVMEYLNGGDLYSLLRNLGCLDEHVAHLYIAELVLALEYLHSLGVVHRDLKPDNILIAHDGHIKLTDFGLSKVGLIHSTSDLSGSAMNGTTLTDINISEGPADYEQGRQKHIQRSAVGTPDYLAPEILLGTEHDYPADWWSTGVILFECLTGMPPFNAEHPQIIFNNILNRNILWPCTEEMSYEARDLIEKLLIECPNQRLGSKGASEVKLHPFFRDINWDTLARQKAAFIPSPESLYDTSYFTSRTGDHMNSLQECVCSSGCCSDSMSTGSFKGRQEEEEDECVGLSKFESIPSLKNSFNNFSFKNLSQLASINYDLLIHTTKGPLNSHSGPPSPS